MKQPVYNYKIYRSTEETFSQTVDALLAAVAESENGKPVRFVFFGKPTSNEEYVDQKREIVEKVILKYETVRPACSYVAQPPMDADMVLEVTYLVDSDVLNLSYKETDDGTPYVVVESEGYKEVIVGGIADDPINHTVREQSKNVFVKVGKLLASENVQASDIVRQWNYIERITDFDGDYQHYQCFNDIRTYFYSRYEWKNGYPAATGIGVTLGGVYLDFNIVVGPAAELVPLDNKLQIPAHDYSQRVLLGVEDKYMKEKTTPKFERGKAVFTDDFKISYISGTAAIRGELSQVSDDVLAQTRTTLHNIAYLVSRENLLKAGVKSCPEHVKYLMLRAYIKHVEDLDTVKKYMENYCPLVEISYLYADVCREELLIEIEGIAEYN